MIYFSFIDFLKACPAFFLLGVAFALLATTLWILPKFLGNIINCITVVFSGNIKGLKNVRPDKNSLCKSEKGKSGNSFISDFLFTLSFGISFILCSYIFLDGYIRLFCAVISFLSFVLFKPRIEKIGVFLVFFFSFFVFEIAKPLAYISRFVRNLLKFVLLPFLCMFRHIFHSAFELKRRNFRINGIDKP